jgi:hypothetical protein
MGGQRRCRSYSKGTGNPNKKAISIMSLGISDPVSNLCSFAVEK